MKTKLLKKIRKTFVIDYDINPNINYPIINGEIFCDTQTALLYMLLYMDEIKLYDKLIKRKRYEKMYGKH